MTFPCRLGSLVPLFWLGQETVPGRSRRVCLWAALLDLLPTPFLASAGTEVAAGGLGPAPDLCHWNLQHHRRVGHGDLE